MTTGTTPEDAALNWLNLFEQEIQVDFVVRNFGSTVAGVLGLPFFCYLFSPAADNSDQFY